MKISLVQMHCVWGKIPVNLRKIEEFAARASEDKADWVLFPELTGFLLLATVLASTIGAPQPPGEGDRVPSKDIAWPRSCFRPQSERHQRA